jgi:hypothetical protein
MLGPSKLLKRTKLERPQPAKPKRPWAVSAIGWLLVLEAAGWLAIAALYVGPWVSRLPFMPAEWLEQRLVRTTGLIFCLLAVLALTSALGFFRMTRTAWLSAVLAQGLNLLLALLLYFSGRPAFVYPLMLYGIFMVLYLHQADVQAAFRQPAEPDKPAPRPAP